MVRLIFVLLAAGALWLGYDALVADRAAAAGDANSAASGEVPDRGTPALEAPPVSSTGAPAPGAPAASAAPGSAAAPGPVESLIAGARRGDGDARARAFATLATLAGADRSRLAAALSEIHRAADIDGKVALLGRNNAFLHTDEGRQAVRATLAAAADLPPERGVQMLTRVLEACMRGLVAKSDTAARSMVDEVYRALRRPLRKTVLNPAHVARARTYKVRPGDSLDRIAHDFRRQGLRVEAGTLAAFNRISDPRRLRADQVLKVPVDPIRTVVEKRSFTMAVYVGDVIFRLYWIAHGKDDCTPVTTFTVGAKQKHPDWYANGRVIPYGHPDNVLGDYFVKFRHDSFTGFGAHGTSQPESIGTMASAGCLRLGDTDIEDYFKIVPRGSEVEIRDSH